MIKMLKALAVILAALLVLSPIAASDLLVFSNTDLRDDNVAPGAKLEVEFDLENSAAKDYKDVVVTAQIEGKDDTKVTKDFGTIAGGSVREGRKMTVQVPDDLKDGSYNVLLKAKGKLLGTGTKTAQAEIPFTVEQEDYSAYVDEVTLSSEKPIAGTSVDVAVKLINNGKNDLEDLKLTVEVPEIRAKQSIRIPSIEQDNEKLIYLTLDIPEDASSGIYTLKVTASNSEASASYAQNIEVTKVAPRVVEAKDKVTPTTVSMPSIKQGQGAVVSLEVTNNQDTAKTYSVVLGGVADWTTSARVDPETVTLGAGDSKTVQVYVLPKEAGDRSFTLYVKSGAELVSAVQVNVKVAATQAPAVTAGMPKIDASWLFAGLVLLAAIVAGVWLYRKGNGDQKKLSGSVYY